MTAPTLLTLPTLPPQATEAIKGLLNAIPMNETVGVKITDVGVGWATGECADTSPFRNHLGTIHAGAQFLLAEATSGAAFSSIFVGFKNAVPLIEKLETHYVNRAKGDITTRAEVDMAEVPAALAQLKAEDKARLIVNVSVVDGENKEVMRAVAHWYIRLIKPKTE